MFVVAVETNCGRVWSEASPLNGFSVETSAEVEQQLRNLPSYLFDREIPFNRGLAILPERDSLLPSVRFALESALYLLNTQAENPSGSLYPTTVHLNGLVQANDPLVMEKVEAMRDKGVKALKVKVGQLSPEKDAAIVREIASMLNSSTALRVDANQAWSCDQATVFCESVSQLSLEYIEEPLKNLREIGELASRTFVPWAIDESLRNVRSEAVFNLPSLEAIVIKPTLLGFNTSYELKQRALASNKQVTLSNVFTSPVAASMELLLANSLQDSAHGYDTLNHVRSEVLDLPTLMQPGMLYISGTDIENFVNTLAKATL